MSSQLQDQPRFRRLLLMVALVISLSITTGSMLFIVYRLASTATTDTGTAIVDADNYFDGATVIDPPRKLDDFTLAGNDGNPLRLSDLAGSVTLLYFGYTNCPDVCPTTLADFQQVKRLLGQAGANVNFVMVSVDGTHDTPDRMRRFLGEFDPAFVGMTGAEQEVRRIGVDFGLYFRDADEDVVNHTNSIFMIDQAGFLRVMFTYGSEPTVIAEDIRTLLA